MDPNDMPVPKWQIAAMLREFQDADLFDDLHRDGVLDLTSLRKFIKRLQRIADPRSQEQITFGELREAHKAVRRTLRDQVRRRRST